MKVQLGGVVVGVESSGTDPGGWWEPEHHPRGEPELGEILTSRCGLARLPDEIPNEISNGISTYISNEISNGIST